MININLLPKNLRRRREPGYWRLIAVLFPLLVIAVAGFMQFTAMNTEQARQEDVNQRQIKLATYQEDLREQRELRARQAQLRELIAIRDAVRANTINWTGELSAMLETLPSNEGSAQPRIAFTQLAMQALDANTQQQRVTSHTYEGLAPIAEMSVQGTAISTEVLAAYIRALENSSSFGVAFQNAAREDDTGLYRFSLTIGALAGRPDETR